MQRYRFADVLTHTGATRSQLIYWTNEELITPDVEDTAGTGYHRAFSFRNLIQVRVATLLAPRGLSVKAIGLVLRALRLSPSATHYPEIAWIPTDTTTAQTVWVGSVREFAHELRQGVAGGGVAGIVIKLQDLVVALREKAEG